jgi:hypothetical protein
MWTTRNFFKKWNKICVLATAGRVSSAISVNIRKYVVGESTVETLASGQEAEFVSHSRILQVLNNADQRENL